MEKLTELEILLRPAGGGVHLVSTGKDAQLELQKQIYKVDTEEDVCKGFVANLKKIKDAKCVILGLPSDVGAGFVRGANMGPREIRLATLRNHPRFSAAMNEQGIYDIGDVFVVPQLLHDEMLSDSQLKKTRDALYQGGEALPVSPLSIAERALDLVLAINPNVVPIVLGGDHSCAWPLTSALAKQRKDRWSIVQSDAHTDLLSERLGVKYCFATWSYHANEIFGRDGRLVQVGIRASGKEKKHWESTLGVKQLWAADVLSNPKESIDDVLRHLKDLNATSVYFSNDIDGTCSRFADATGTPEPGGLEPDWLIELIRRLGSEIGICAGDVMEVAPPLASGQKTEDLAAKYMVETIAAALQIPLLDDC